jgi:hypothetical protein
MYCADIIPQYVSVPDRWLVFRHVAESQPPASLGPALEVFLVESNKIRNVSDVIDAGEDPETAASPFLDPGRVPEDQLRTVLGRVSLLADDWNPGAGGADSREAAAAEGYLSPFSVLETGNLLFADYSPHNAAVFTLHDNLAWGDQLPGSTESATISYVVYGFRAQDARQLLSSPAGNPTPASTSVVGAAVEQEPIQTCWGSLYSVKYHRSEPPSIIHAATVAKDFTESIAIGDGVVDACVALLEGSPDTTESGLAGVLDGLSSDAALPESNSQLDRADSSVTNFKSAHGGYRWRLATDEDKDASPVPGQPVATTRESSLMSAGQVAALSRLNAAQTYLDALHRRRRYLRHLIFCEWWKHRSLHGETDGISVQRRAQAARRAEILLERMEVANTLLASTAQHIITIQEGVKPYGPFTRGEDGKFYSHTDPTFALRDVGSGWPADWGSAASVVESEQFDAWLSSNAQFIKTWVDSSPFSKDAAPTTKARIPDVWDRLVHHPGLAELPAKMMTALRNIMMVTSHELAADQPVPNPLVTNPSWTERNWNGQPWLPLFVEWEAEYVHIPSERWELRHDDDGTVHYGLRSELSFEGYDLGSRTFSGRAILLPDAQKIMAGLLEMMYRTVPGAASQGGAEKKWAKEMLSRVRLLFGRLDGFTDHLLTLHQGAHVVPIPSQGSIANDKEESPRVAALLAEYRDAERLFADQDALELLYGDLRLPGDSPDGKDASGGLDVTPYGISHEGLSYSSSQNLNRPAEKDRFFRPATHGQARLTQFKIVDRFGQVVCATDPRPDQPARPFYPHMGTGILCEPLSPDGDGVSEPRTALPLTPEEIANGDCPWFQLGPRINQDARLHADFMCDLVLPDGTRCEGKYQPVGAGEHAVFAWLLINFHNSSLQVYDREGAFKDEAFLPSGPDEPVYWQSLVGRGGGQDILPHMLPHESDARVQQRLEQIKNNQSPMTPAATVVTSQGSTSSELPMSLEDLFVSMSHAPFLIQLWETVVAAQDHIATPAPQQYAQVPSALVGRPLALAHLGLGLELATAPMRSQAYADYYEEYPADEGAAAGDDDGTDDPSETTGDEELTRYAFAVKLGDMLGRQDGLVAYFRPPAPSPTTLLPQPAAWTITTDYTPKSSSSIHVQHPTSAPLLTVHPSYPRLLPARTIPKSSLSAQQEIQAYQHRRAASLYTSIVTVLVDPYLPVHVRSGILPVATAQLSRNMVEHEISRLGVWLRAGPVVVGARGADPVAPAEREKGEMRIQMVVDGTSPTRTPAAPRVPVQTPLAAGTGAEWKWVQPVMVEEQPVPSGGEGSGGRDGQGPAAAAALDASVHYVRLGTMDPLRTGFDAVAGANGNDVRGQKAEIAVALEGFLVLEKQSNAPGV